MKIKLKELISEVLSQTNFSDTTDNNIDKRILRAAILAEIDAINLYEQFANDTTNSKIKTVLLDIAREEKTHIGEFQALLEEIDQEYSEELNIGKKEVNDLTESNDHDQLIIFFPNVKRYLCEYEGRGCLTWQADFAKSFNNEQDAKNYLETTRYEMKYFKIIPRLGAKSY